MDFCLYVIPGRVNLQIKSNQIISLYCTSRILAWEDGFCNFAASACDHEGAAAPVAAAAAGQDAAKGLQPELFFKMSHDIYNYGEGYVK